MLAVVLNRIMIATISLYEPLHESLKTVNKRGTVKKFKYVVEFGPFVFIKPSESSAHNFLLKTGFVLNDDCATYSHKYKSDDQLNLERLYKKH